MAGSFDVGAHAVVTAVAAQTVEPAATAATANPPPLIHGSGTSEAQWQACAGLQALPLLPLDTLLPAAARLVVVAPHPDDEVLACGGLIAAHGARGGRVQVLAVTDGEASHDGCPGCTPAALAATRRAESVAGLQRLVLPLQHAAPRAVALRLGLGLPDGGVTMQTDHLVALLRQQLQADDIVVTTWQHDGHPDHDATGAATALACRAIGCRLLQAPVWMWHWAACGDPRVPWARLRGVALPAAAWTCKQQALSAHASQLAARSSGQGPVLGDHIVQRARRRVEHVFID